MKNFNRKQKFLGLIFTILCSTTVRAQVQPEFNPTTMPSKAEWQHFQKMSESNLQKLWDFQASRGHPTMASWAWQWRIGWVQRCESLSNESFCHKIISEGLTDDAVVVRAEAATAAGNRYRASQSKDPQSKDIVQKLQAAYSNPKNSRNGKPLFVCDRILNALQSIGGKHAYKTANKLAAKHQQTKRYWAKLNETHAKF